MFARWVMLAAALAACDGAADEEAEGARAGRAGLLWGTLALPAGGVAPGRSTFGFALADADARPVSGATVTATAWMPAHGHGAPEAPVVTEVGDGEYAIDAVLQMPGRWELSVEARAGDVADGFDFVVDVE